MCRTTELILIKRMEENGQDENSPVKVVFVGDSGVGKTSLMQRYAYDCFREDSSATIGVAFIAKKVNLSKPKAVVNFHIWDTAGQEKYRSMAKAHYQDAAATILVYDITNRETYEGLKEWMKELKENVHEGTIVAIAANKSDLVDEEVVKVEEVKSYAQQENALLYLTSAKSNVGIQELFTEIAKKIIAKRHIQQEVTVAPSSF